MKYLIQYIVTLLLLLAVKAAGAQTTADGWVIENIHGPSQVGIVDTIPVDINHDGLMDVVSASIEDGHLRAYINQGINQDSVIPVFNESYISNDVFGVYRVSATDLNNDGEVDFLLPSIEKNEIIVLVHDQNSQPFGYRKVIIAENILLPTDAQAGDFNGDGLMDVVSISFEMNAVFLHTQNPEGNFSIQLVTDKVIRPRKLVVARFNTDIYLDFMVASSEDNSIRLFHNIGDAVFEEQLISNQMTGTRYLSSCDADNNNLIDLVVSATGINTVYLFSNLGNGNFSEQVIDDELLGVTAIHCADLDKDQQHEIVAIASQVGNIYTQELNGTNRKLIANSRDGYISADTAIFDYNDSIKILTQAYFENRNLLYGVNQGNDEQVVWEDFPDGAYHIDVGDIDGDGDEDLVVASFRNDLVYWIERKENSFLNRQISTLVDGPQSVVVGDMDNDDDLDVVSAGAWDNSFWLHTNVGLGVFETTLIFDSAFNAARAKLADMNNDGLKDVVISSSLDNSIRILYQTKSGFSVLLIDPNLVGAYDIDVGDFNRDGFLDIIGSGLRDSIVNLYTNDGNNNYIHNIIYRNTSRTNAVDITDIDGDGLHDVSFIKDGLIVNLVNSSKLYFEQIASIVDFEDIREFLLFNDDMANNLVFFGTAETGNFYVTIFSLTVGPLKTILSNRFRARSLVMAESKLGFYTVSNTENAVKRVFKDLIMKNGFESLE